MISCECRVVSCGVVWSFQSSLLFDFIFEYSCEQSQILQCPLQAIPQYSLQTDTVQYASALPYSIPTACILCNAPIPYLCKEMSLAYDLLPLLSVEPCECDTSLQGDATRIDSACS